MAALATNQAPRHSNPGQEGEERWIWLRLKLIADAGLVGLPNAGKSTFLASVSSAKPKIADYPFTTLHPNLGVVGIDTREFVMADIPGLIEGAHEGVGIGDRFLGHVERCRVLLHLIDATQDDYIDAYRIIRGELEAYDEGLGQKDEIVALTKIDSLSDEDLAEKLDTFEAAYGFRPKAISAVAKTNMDDILRALLNKVDVENKREADALIEPVTWRP